jgi:hypothetical protein
MTGRRDSLYFFVVCRHSLHGQATLMKVAGNMKAKPAECVVYLGVRASRRQGVMAVVDDEVLIRMHAHPYLSTHARLAGDNVDRYYPDTFMRSILSLAQHACNLSEGRQSQGVRVTDHVAAHAISPVLLLSLRTTTTGSGRLPRRSPLAGRWSGSGGRTVGRRSRPSAPASRTAPRRWLVE